MPYYIGIKTLNVVGFRNAQCHMVLQNYFEMTFPDISCKKNAASNRQPAHKNCRNVNNRFHGGDTLHHVPAYLLIESGKGKDSCDGAGYQPKVLQEIFHIVAGKCCRILDTRVKFLEKS